MIETIINDPIVVISSNDFFQAIIAYILFIHIVFFCRGEDYVFIPGKTSLSKEMLMLLFMLLL